MFSRSMLSDLRVARMHEGPCKSGNPMVKYYLRRNIIELTIGVLIRNDSRIQAWTKFILRKLVRFGSSFPSADKTSSRACF